jgi:hypothetical protein
MAAFHESLAPDGRMTLFGEGRIGAKCEILLIEAYEKQMTAFCRGGLAVPKFGP